MGLFDNMKKFFAAPQDSLADTSEAETETAAAEIIADEGGGGWYTLPELAESLNNSDGMNANKAFSRIGTVYSCVDRRATALAKLPFNVYRKKDGFRERADEHRLNYLLSVRPNRYQSPMAYKKYIVACQLLWGFACIYKKYSPVGELLELIPWRPQEVGVYKLLNCDEYVYTYRGETYTEDEVIYIPYLSADGKRGKAPMSVARESAIAVNNMTKHLSAQYKNGSGFKQGALKTNQDISPGNKKKLKQEWVRLNGGYANSGDPAILDAGLEWVDISLPLSDMQFIESKRLTALEIATIFNVPGSSVGLSQEKYSNLQEINDRFMQDVVAPDCINIEEAHNFSCFREDEKGFYTKFNLSAGMRGAPDKRAAYYREMTGMGAMCINEVRALEDMNGIGEMGDKYFVSCNLTTIDTIEQHERIKKE